MWFVKKVAPLVAVAVSQEVLLHNLETVRRRVGACTVWPVLKANAYGHGLCEVAKVVADVGVPRVCVDSYYEALMLRRGGLRVPILVIGHSTVEQMVVSRLRDVVFSVSDSQVIERLVRECRSRIDVHLEVDTGMHRHGVLVNDLEQIARMVGDSGNIRVVGLFSHFADADTIDSVMTRKQLIAWKDAVEIGHQVFPELRELHLAATAGIAGRYFYGCTAVRLGIGLYGFDVGVEKMGLLPALELCTQIVALRIIEEGECVGYNGTYVATRRMKIATVPIGYYEGVDRRLSNKGWLYVRGMRCSIIGRVSMNMTTVDVSDIHDVQIGDEVVMKDIAEMARLCETITYEILVHIPEHLKRLVVK
jgi:alanine racemase